MNTDDLFFLNIYRERVFQSDFLSYCIWSWNSLTDSWEKRNFFEIRDQLDLIDDAKLNLAELTDISELAVLLFRGMIISSDIEYSVGSRGLWPLGSGSFLSSWFEELPSCLEVNDPIKPRLRFVFKNGIRVGILKLDAFLPRTASQDNVQPRIIALY